MYLIWTSQGFQRLHLRCDRVVVDGYGAIPNGGMIAEMLIISLYGFPMEALPVIAAIAIIIDVPATMLNVTGDNVASMLVAKRVEGKNWTENENHSLSL